MIVGLIGVVEKISALEAHIEVQGVVYGVQVSMRTVALLQAGQKARLKILKAQMLELQKINNECYAKLISIENSFQHASITTKNPFKQENIVIYHRNYPKVSNLSAMLSHNESVNVIYEDHKIKKIPKSAIKG